MVAPHLARFQILEYAHTDLQAACLNQDLWDLRDLWDRGHFISPLLVLQAKQKDAVKTNNFRMMSEPGFIGFIRD